MIILDENGRDFAATRLYTLFGQIGYKDWAATLPDGLERNISSQIMNNCIKNHVFKIIT